MTPKHLVNILPVAPPIAPQSQTTMPCENCGNTMQRVRRTSLREGERQSFICQSCGNCSDRTVGLLARKYA
jgi:hypothetical protein